MEGETDFGALEGYLSFNPTSRTFTLSGVNSNTLADTYVLVVHVEEDQDGTTNTANKITLVISPETIVLTQPGNMPTTVAYTVGDGSVTFNFDAYSCNIDCGAISYTSFLTGGSDFGAIDSFFLLTR